MENNYVVYHAHTDRSILDSCTKFQDYIDKATELGQKAIAFTEHGNIYSWVSKKMACDKANIKYIHGAEVYLTERLEPKIRDNYHTILLAKNYEGVKEINLLMGTSNQEDHFYYKPRISFDEFFNISNNVIKISACLASPLRRLPDGGIKDKLLLEYDYYEIQPHINSQEQKEYNIYLYEASKKYNKPLIMGTDTHSLNAYKAGCRKILMKAKKIEYTGEDNFDLTYKSYEELLNMCREQNCFDFDVYLNAINNTNIMADSVEAFDFDKSIKYPILYGSQENDEKKYQEVITESYKHKLQEGIITNNPKYLENIKEEFRVFKKLGMNGFMLFMSELIRWCHDNGIPTGFGRGSCCGSTIAYLTDIIDVDPVVWSTVFSRFCNEFRKEIGDIDEDFSPDQREQVYNYIINRFGSDYTAYVLALGTVVDKGCIDEVGRALDIPLSEVAQIKEEYGKDPEGAKKKYPDLFYYFDGIINTVISQSMHPAGIIASPKSLPDNYGVFYNDGKPILYIDMEEVHDCGLVKYDILGLKNVQILKDVCKMAAIPYPRSYSIDWNDQKVWEDIKISPVGIFQFEKIYAFEMMKKYNCKNLDDITLITAAIRPSGESYRDRLISGEYNKNPSELIDKILDRSHGFLVYQEQTIQFLQECCGLSGGEADNVRRAIGRKQIDRLNEALPAILEGYCTKSGKPRAQAEEEAKSFLKVIEDSASYQFGFNHSLAYSMISYMCGYYRYYYPLEFVCSYLNNANNEEDIQMGTELAKIKDISLHPIQFGRSGAIYTIDKTTNSIYKGVASIKYLNSQSADELLSLSKNGYTSFPDLYEDIKTKTSLNSKQFSILAQLGYFSNFGKSKKILTYAAIFDKFYNSKQIKKDKQYLIDIIDSIPPVEVSINRLSKYCEKETEKQYSCFNYKGFLKDIWDEIGDKELPLNVRLFAQKEYLGYIEYVNPDLKDVYYIIKYETPYSKSEPYIEAYALWDKTTLKIKIKDGNLINDKNEFNVHSVIKINCMEQRYKKRRELFVGNDIGWSKKEIKMGYRWSKSEETEWILTGWQLIKR